MLPHYIPRFYHRLSDEMEKDALHTEPKGIRRLLRDTWGFVVDDQQRIIIFVVVQQIAQFHVVGIAGKLLVAMVTIWVSR